MGNSLGRNGRLANGERITINNVSYTIEGILGEGGFGKVYAARAPNLPPVAIKETRLAEMPTEKMRHNARMYLNEIHLLKRLQLNSSAAAKCIVTIYDYDFNYETGIAYLIEERGVPFEKVLGKKPIVAEPKRRRYFHGMSSSLAVLHSHLIVHSDLKPANFIVCQSQIKIIDLGTSFTLPAFNTMANRQAIGTPGYMAPEQRGTHGRATYGYKSDIYSLGAILYEMTVGKTPPSDGFRNFNECRNIDDTYLRELLNMMLQLNPMLRPSIQQVLLHPYTTFLPPTPNHSCE